MNGNAKEVGLLNANGKCIDEWKFYDEKGKLIKKVNY